MSSRSERRLRRIIVASTGVSLLGVATAFFSYGAPNSIFAISDVSAEVRNVVNNSFQAEPGAVALTNRSEYLFRSGSKGDRADFVEAIALKAEGAKANKVDQPEMVTAALVEAPHVATPQKSDVVYEVNRGGKGDLLSVPQVTVGKYVAPPSEPTVLASADIFLVAPPLADSMSSAEPTNTKSVASTTVKQDGKIIVSADAKGDGKLSSADLRESGESSWDDLVKMASVKGGNGEEKDTNIFGGLSEKEFRARELRCMATAVYFEARDEPLRGQIAVAQVIMTRLRSERYPKTICGVVYQGQWNKNACQFSFACDGKPDDPKEKKEWATSLDVARQVISGKVYLTDIADATHYHATYVHPDWVKLVKRVKQIGGHIFYKAPFDQPLIANADYSNL
jgi:spore germination cell wall hydrolase CwlJ-like protein